MIILTIVGGIAGIITVIWLFLLRPKETKILEEKIKGMVALVSPLQDSVFEFVPKDELEFGKIIKKADSLFHQEKFKEAEEEYKKAYNIVKDSQKGKLIGLSLLGIGAAKGSQGNYKEAIEIFKSSLKYEKEIKDNEAIARIYFNLGYCYQFDDNLKEAIKSYNMAITLNPNYAEAYINRGLAYYKKGEIEKAIDDFNKAIELNPNFAPAMALIGRAYHKKGDKEKARYWYNKALEKKEYLTEEQINLILNWLKEL